MPLGSVTHPWPFPVSGNRHSRAPSPRWYLIEVFVARINGPIKWGMTLLATNEFAGLVVFWAWSLYSITPQIRIIPKYAFFPFQVSVHIVYVSGEFPPYLERILSVCRNIYFSSLNLIPLTSAFILKPYQEGFVRTIGCLKAIWTNLCGTLNDTERS